MLINHEAMQFLPEDDSRREVWEHAQSPIEQYLASALFALLGCKAVSGPFDRSRLPQLAEQAGDAPACFVFAQHPIGIYCADFLLVIIDPQRRKSKLVAIECDGKAYHFSEKQMARDKRRDTEIKEKGYKIIRLSGSRIHRELPLTIAVLKDWLSDYNVICGSPDGLKGYAGILSWFTPCHIEMKERHAKRLAYWQENAPGDEALISADDETLFRWSDTL
jgi:very-short-patch-repair endonuclease